MAVEVGVSVRFGSRAGRSIVFDAQEAVNGAMQLRIEDNCSTNASTESAGVASPCP